MVYKRLIYRIETSDIHYHAITFMCACMIGQRGLNDVKPFLPQSQFFGIPPRDARRWEPSQLRQILPTQHIRMSGQQCPKPTGPR